MARERGVARPASAQRSTQKGSSVKRTSIIIAVVCFTVAAGLIVLLAALDWGRGPVPSGITGDIDRHFIEEMIPHHEDAVAMAELAPDRAEHDELRQLAETIKTNQSREIDQMRAWYEEWYGVAVPEDGFGDDAGMMGMGMMSDGADLRVLEGAKSFDKEFIEQMIPHHQMGIMMARMVLARTDRPEIQELARSIIRTQSDEIEQMRAWYEEWYGD